MGLYRKKEYSSVDDVFGVILKELEGPGQQFSYRFMHLKCKALGLNISRKLLMEAFQITDPIGVEMRKRRRLQRRWGYSKGPCFMYVACMYVCVCPSVSLHISVCLGMHLHEW